MARRARNEADENVVPSRIPSTHPQHQPRSLTEAERARFRSTAKRARRAKAAAMRGDGPPPIHPIYSPRLEPDVLMPQADPAGLRSLSLFSGGGGLDIGFARAGYEHVASFEILEDAAATLVKANPDWSVYGGAEGDVTEVSWRRYRNQADVLHGGPPCQPFSTAGRQQGPADRRDMWPAMVNAILEARPAAFVAENVPALGGPKFAPYVQSSIVGPLERHYRITMMLLEAERFGVPQLRRRVVFVGFRSARAAKAFRCPEGAYRFGENPEGHLSCMGAREALGLPPTGFDALAPTIRSGLTGPRHTTSVLSSRGAQRTWEALGIWPNGIARDRESARLFVAKHGHYRMSVDDVALLQGFPPGWPFAGAVYMMLGQIGNAVPPPMAYAVATSVRVALLA